MTDTDMLYMAAQEKRITELSEENKILMSEADRLIKEKGQLLKINEDMKQQLCELGDEYNAQVNVAGFFESTNKILVEREEELKGLLCELRPILRKAFFAHYEPQNKADELYDRIVKIVGKE